VIGPQTGETPYDHVQIPVGGNVFNFFDYQKIIVSSRFSFLMPKKIAI